PVHTLNLVDVLRWPGVLKEDASGGEELMVATKALFGSTLEDLVAARAREGLRRKEILELRCTGLEDLVSQVRQRLPEVQTRLRARLDERVKEITRTSIRTGWSRSSRYCCSVWTSMRSSSASQVTSRK